MNQSRRKVENCEIFEFGQNHPELMCTTPLGKICASGHAMNAVDEMSALNRDMKAFFEEVGAPYEIWKQVEKTAAKYLK